MTSKFVTREPREILAKWRGQSPATPEPKPVAATTQSVAAHVTATNPDFLAAAREAHAKSRVDLAAAPQLWRNLVAAIPEESARAAWPNRANQVARRILALNADVQLENSRRVAHAEMRAFNSIGALLKP